MPHDQGVVYRSIVRWPCFIAFGCEGDVPHSDDRIVRSGGNGQQGPKLAIPQLWQQGRAVFCFALISATCEGTAAEKRPRQNDSQGQSEFANCWFHVISFLNNRAAPNTCNCGSES